MFDVHFLTQAPEEWTVSGITPGPNTFSYFSQKGLSSALRECDFKSGLATLMTDDKLREVQDMLTVTKRAAVLLKAAKNAEGAANNAGIRILRNAKTAESEKPTVGLAVADAPYPDDKEFEQQGLRILVEDALIELLDDRILDVREGYEGPELVLR